MYHTIVREPPTFEGGELYHGAIKYYPLGNQTLLALEDCALWYMEFLDATQNKSFYLGVLDIDIARPPDVDYEQLKLDTLKTIDALVKSKFSDYQIFDSGNKGYHVYVFSERLWRAPTDPKTDHKIWISGQLKELFGDELFNMIDLSTHFIGKGIRPYTTPHPKTKRLPQLVISTVPADLCFWYWFVNDVIANAMIPVTATSSQQPVEAVPSPMPLRLSGVIQTIDREAVGGTIIEKLNRLYSGGDVQVKDGNLYLIKQTKWCCFVKADHKVQKNYIRLIGEHALIMCHSGKCANQKLYISKDYMPLTDFGNLLTKHCAPEHVPVNRRILSKTQEYISKEDIDWCLDDKGFGAVFAPMGSGKTQALESWLKEKPETYRCMLVIVRKNQSTYFAHRYGDFVDYQKKTGSLHGVTRLVICINSLMRLLLDGNLPRFDLLILDEIESIIEAAVSKILSSGRSEQTNIWNILALLCKSCDKTLIMDGIPTEHTISYFSGLGLMKEFRVIEHHRQPDFRVYKCHCDQTEFIKSINDDLAIGKNIVLVTNTKEVQTMIYNEVTVEPKLMINADSPKKIKNTSKKPNEKWNVRFLAYNNAVGAGQSFDLSHFHCMYAVVSPISCYPQSFYQLICRIRKLKESNVHLLVIHNEAGHAPSKEELKIAKLKNIVHFHSQQIKFTPRLSLFNTSNAENVRLDICETDYKIVRTLAVQQHLKLKHEDDFFINMLVDYEHEKLALRDSGVYCEVFFDMIHRNGGVVLPLREDQQNKLRASTQQMKLDARKLAMDAGVNANHPFWSSDKVPPHVAKVWNELVDLGDLNKHYRWLTLRNRIIDDESKVYEREFDSINQRGRALSNCMLYGHGVLQAFTRLATECGFQIDKKRGMFTGTCSILNFFEKEASITKACQTIFDQLYNETGTRITLSEPKKNTYSARNLAIWQNLKKLFSKFGIRLDYNAGRGSRKMVRGQRLVASTFTFCELTQHIRMAISDIEYDTGDKASNGVEYFMQKSNKYF